MGNILVGIGKFLKNKNTVTIIAVLLAVGVLYAAYYYRIKMETDPVSVPYATREIGPREEITGDMISTRQIPGGVVNKNVMKNRNEIIGKYVNYNSVIPENGLFYKDMLVNWEDLPTSLFEDIPDGNTVILLPVSLDKTCGNSIYPGNYIDLYYQSWKEDSNNVNKVFFGKFIESIKVLAVVDDHGNNVFETAKSPKTPASLMFSVPEDMHLLLRKALAKREADIIPVPRNAAYSLSPSPTRIVNNEIKKHIEEDTVATEIVADGGDDK